MNKTLAVKLKEFKEATEQLSNLQYRRKEAEKTLELFDAVEPVIAEVIERMGKEIEEHKD